MSSKKDISPIPSTVDKYEEAYYFLNMLWQHYHEPQLFRFNLNAFFQSLRNITFILQNEEKKPDGFNDWYKNKQAEMRKDQTLRNFVQARNLIVKKEMLKTKSRATIGLFRGRKMKLTIKKVISPFQKTSDLLEIGKKFFIGFVLDKEHTAIGEQIGVKREWIVDLMGEDEIISYCIYALSKLGKLIEEAHELFGLTYNSLFEIPNKDCIQILLETDLDPSLIIKWGWE